LPSPRSVEDEDESPIAGYHGAEGPGALQVLGDPLMTSLAADLERSNPPATAFAQGVEYEYETDPSSGLGLDRTAGEVILLSLASYGFLE
jgi:hypothetical protein